MSAFFGLGQPQSGSLAGGFALGMPNQNPATIRQLWGPAGSPLEESAYRGGGYTMGGGGLAFGSRRGNEMFAPLSPLAMSLRGIENDPSGGGMQAYKTALMGAGINPYAHEQSQNTGLPGQGMGWRGHADTPEQQQNLEQRGRQVFDVTRNFVQNYAGPGGPNYYQQLLQQRQQQGSANPGADFGHYRSFLQHSLAG